MREIPRYAISIRQPWAWAILHAGKDIENRSWATRYRGPVLIHSSLKFDDEGLTFLRIRLGHEAPIKGDYSMGGIVGSAEIVDCVRYSDSKWFFGPFGFVLRNPRPLVLHGGQRIVPCRGALGLFQVADAVRGELQERLAA